MSRVQVEQERKSKGSSVFDFGRARIFAVPEIIICTKSELWLEIQKFVVKKVKSRSACERNWAWRGFAVCIYINRRSESKEKQVFWNLYFGVFEVFDFCEDFIVSFCLNL